MFDFMRYWDYYNLKGSPITSATDFDILVSKIQQKYVSLKWVWRGLANREYALTSSLYRELCRVRRASGVPPFLPPEGLGVTTPKSIADADSLVAVERRLLDEFRQWLKPFTSNPLLSWSARDAVAALALMQHNSTPTRLIDASTEPLVALWFATETAGPSGAADGRIICFAYDDASTYSPTRSLSDPFWWKSTPQSGWTKGDYRVLVGNPNWSQRISAQSGAFVLAGVFETGGGGKGAQLSSFKALNPLTLDQVRVVSPHGIRAHKGLGARGVRAIKPVLTFTISAAAKAGIRDQLRRNHGLTSSSLFPDQAGFTAYVRTLWDI